MKASLAAQELVSPVGEPRFVTVVPAQIGAWGAVEDAQADSLPLLSPELARLSPTPDVRLDEAAFRYALNEDAMATEKLAEGIRAFAADAVKLEAMIAQA
mgnify:CR=1 FL=1